ncbi:MAG: ATP-binding cassette domain-containing protein [Metallosphaera sp.]
MKFVEVSNLRVTYLGRTRPSLEVEELAIDEGESVLVLGKSGSGKSTLVNVLNGVIPHMISARVEGEIRVFGKDPRKTPVHEMSHLVGTLLQDPEAQIFHHIVRDELAFAPENYCFPRDEILSRVNEASKIVGVTHLMERETSTLSGGELQRVVLGSVLTLKPKSLILDEPTSNIDPDGTAEILSLLRSFKEGGISMIIVEHKLERVLPYVDRVILVEDGRVTLNVTRKELPKEMERLMRAGVEVPEVRRTVSKRNTTGRAILKGKVKVNSGGKVLVDTEIEVREGEIVALMGKNGAGKTTLLKAIMGILDNRYQVVAHLTMMDKEISKMPYYVRGRFISYLPQSFDVMFVKRTVEDEIKFSSDDPEQLIRLFSLDKVRKDDPLTLSFGQRRRVALASILGRRQRLALLDEPTSGQDWFHRRSLGEELQKMRENGVSFLVVTHDSRFVDRFCDRVMVMREGKIIYSGSPEQVFESRLVMPPVEYEGRK